MVPGLLGYDDVMVFSFLHLCYIPFWFAAIQRPIDLQVYE